MIDRPLVTLFVIAYNQERYVGEAIEGAFAQTYQPLEILLSDDCSVDGTFRVMEKMVAAYDGPHTLILNRNPENLGLIAHVDRVVELSSGDLIVANAGDDISESYRVLTLIEAWEATGRRVDSIHSAAMRIDFDGTQRGVQRPPSAGQANPSPLEIVRGNLFVIGATQAWSRRLCERFGPLAETGALIEDRPLPFRAALWGGIAYVDRPLLRYRTLGMSVLYRRLSGRDYLYGQRLKYLRWFASCYRGYLRDMEKIDFPEREACRAVCRARIPLLEFEIGLAETGYLGRLFRLPAALQMSLRNHNATPLVQTIKYLFDSLYMAYLDTKHATLQRMGRI